MVAVAAAEPATPSSVEVREKPLIAPHLFPLPLTRDPLSHITPSHTFQSALVALRAASATEAEAEAAVTVVTVAEEGATVGAEAVAGAEA